MQDNTDQHIPTLEKQTAPSKDKLPLTLEDLQKLIEDTNKPQFLTHYADPILPLQYTSTQLVSVLRVSSTSPSLSTSDELETHGIFQNYRSFHRMSGDQDREARASSYRELINLMLFQTSEDTQLINVPPSRAKTEGPFRSNL